LLFSPNNISSKNENNISSKNETSTIHTYSKSEKDSKDVFVVDTDESDIPSPWKSFCYFFFISLFIFLFFNE
jgi:hypothetical protein